MRNPQFTAIHGAIDSPMTEIQGSRIFSLFNINYHLRYAGVELSIEGESYELFSRLMTIDQEPAMVVAMMVMDEANKNMAVRMTVREANFKQASIATFDNQKINETIQTFCTWRSGHQIQTISEMTKSFLAFMFIAESQLKKDETDAVDFLIGCLEGLGVAPPDKLRLKRWRINFHILLQWMENEYWQERRMDIYDIFFDGK